MRATSGEPTALVHPTPARRRRVAQQTRTLGGSTYPDDVVESSPELHPDVAVLAPLLGTWAGTGSGEYPTIDAFDYLEEVTFGHVGKPFLTYRQRTKSRADGRPLHAETGYLRVPRPGHVEWVLAHPTGITEIEEGALTVEAGTIVMELAATSIGLTGSAKHVRALERSLTTTGDELTYTLRMGAVGQPLQHHLSATLRRKQA